MGHGSAVSVAGGPFAALAFALGCCARRRRPLEGGDVISTGACTGIHQIRIGEEARVAFAGAPELRCRMLRATPAADGLTP